MKGEEKEMTRRMEEDGLVKRTGKGEKGRNYIGKTKKGVEERENGTKWWRRWW